MSKCLSRIIWRWLLIICILQLKGVWCTRWDPLPEGVRSVVSSNHLSESTPQVFAEYHALLPNYRGDYGIKSKLVEAATQNPTYKGANTLILPLYIPQGAIPLAINDRSVRSGKTDGIVNMRIIRGGPLPSIKALSNHESLNRALNRRIIITGRRFGELRSPTPPPSFLRSWLRRDPSLAKNQDNVEAAKRVKQSILSQKAHAKRRGETASLSTRDHQATTQKSLLLPKIFLNGDQNFPLKEVTRVKKIMTKLEENISEDTTPRLVSRIIEIRKIKPDQLSTKIIMPTEASKINKNSSSLDNIEKVTVSIRTKSTNNTSPAIETTTAIHPNPSTTKSESSSTIKITTETNATKKQPISIPKPVKDIVRTVIKPVMPSFLKLKSTSQTESSTITTTISTESSNKPLSTTKPNISHSNVKSQQKAPSWLLRRRASLLKEMIARKANQKYLRTRQDTTDVVTESIIDRVLNSAANQKIDLLSKINSTTSSSTTVFTTANVESTTTKIISKQHTLSTTSSPVVTSTLSTTKLHQNRHRIPIRVRRPIISNPVRITSTPQTKIPSKRQETFFSRENYQTNKDKEIYATNIIVTSTPKFSVINLSSSEGKKEKKSTLRNKEHSTTTNAPVSKSTNSYLPIQKMKSPQDIVLEKLSELMKNATDGTKESLEDIAREIEKLNEELGVMGIHIIDAEFGGQKIILKDRLKFNKPGGNFSRATTIRYIIPNTKRKNISQWPSFKNSKPTITTSRTTERSYFTLTHPESPTRKVFTPSSNSDLMNKSDINNTTHTQFVTISPVTHKTVIDKEHSRTFKISASTTVPESDSTRTRSIIIPINAQVHPEEVQSISKDIITPKLKSINPTAHLRPDASTAASIATESTTAQLPGPVSSDFLPNDVNDEENQILYNNNKVLNALNATMHPSEYEGINDVKHTVEESGSYIYFIAILGVIPCTAALIFLYRQRHKRQLKALPEREERADGCTPPTNHSRSTCKKNTLDAFPGYILKAPERESPWELSRSKLRITSVIGEGNFGIVWKAEARNLCDWEEDGGPTVLVAVKGVKEGAGVKEKTDLLRELSIMKVLGQHNNIVTLLGCCTKQEPYYLVMEYVMFGKLLEFLREQRSKNNYYNFSSDTDHLTSRDLTKFACQIATGCEYLQSRGIIHRDLAARNILVDHNKICKIADFGLARSVKDTDDDIYEQKSKGPLPIRWMAPESMYMNIYTHKSDVWSFGILCWEIVTLGSTPYPGISAREVMRRVREGYRLERPEHCRTEFYKILTKCWTQEMASRVRFNTIREELRELLDNSSGWIDLENFQEATYYSMHQNNDEKL